ncbi:MAG: hypothetical protein HDQ99_00260 [Lachnospiraceae bacterium]|nr:hypothetical protein [Lachnospiraceae bacterium]
MCTQSGGIQTGQLQTGSFYKLLVLRNETWQEVPYLIADVAWKTISDFRGSGDYDTEECWVEFEIK